MTRATRLYYITHTDQYGETHQLSGAWEADRPEYAIAQMLAEAGTDDDGNWQAHIVLSESDIIR